jgi:hypothetical protein
MAIYRLDLPLRAERFLLTCDAARRLLPPASPRSGLAVVEEDGDLWLGIYLDPRDHRDVDTLVEETSHWVCLTWHAAHERPVSRLQLELQGEVDRYAVARLTAALPGLPLGGRRGCRHAGSLRDGPPNRPPLLPIPGAALPTAVRRARPAGRAEGFLPGHRTGEAALGRRLSGSSALESPPGDPEVVLTFA